MQVRYVVVRVGSKRHAISSLPRSRHEVAMRDLDELQTKRPGTDFRLAKLLLPTVAPYSDFWRADESEDSASAEVTRHIEHLNSGSPVLDAGCVWCEAWMHSLEVAAGLVRESRVSS